MIAATRPTTSVENSNCIRFQRWANTRRQMVANDCTGAPTLTDMGANFGISTARALTLFIAVPPNGRSVWVRVVDEVLGAVFEQEITADLPSNAQFLSRRFIMNNRI